MTKKEIAHPAYEEPEKIYPDIDCTFDYSKPYELMFAVILSIFICAFLFCENPALLLLIAIIMILLCFCIKHYYFPETRCRRCTRSMMKCSKRKRR